MNPRMQVCCLVAALAPIPTGSAQTPSAPSPFTCTMLASQRTQEVGCYMVGSETLTSLRNGPLFWHLYTYPTLDAATHAK
jgi:hypothetical protein